MAVDVKMVSCPHCGKGHEQRAPMGTGFGRPLVRCPACKKDFHILLKDGKIVGWEK